MNTRIRNKKWKQKAIRIAEETAIYQMDRKTAAKWASGIIGQFKRIERRRRRAKR